MSAGMAGIIAAHSDVGVDPQSWAPGATIRWTCYSCGAVEEAPSCETTKPEWHGQHVAEELAKAGYGLVPDVTPEYGARVMQLNGLSEEPHPQGPNPNPSWFSKSTHVRMVGLWKELAALPDPLGVAMNDEEGRALVQAIHDRKAEGKGALQIRRLRDT